MKNLSDAVEEHPEMNEERLRTKFFREGILEKLGYSENEIFLEERTPEGKRTDIHCTDEFGDVIFVMEFKNPGVKNLKNYKDDLWKKYVNPLKAEYGVLYNGKKYREIIFMRALN
ncbi:MAG: type I restriction enzyme HsdR N-terminal domain-containing protein [Euryarchaeota archaeon]|nr:type I restriction enzyme HsdR N-terminal domain-containing protein [Euryarchaeota archaeon]